MSTKNTMGVLLLVEVQLKPGSLPQDAHGYQDLVTAEFAAMTHRMNVDPFFPFEVVSVKQAVAP